jgi:anti-sigma28 factor (negative regulator of flagellin synthesis)
MVTGITHFSGMKESNGETRDGQTSRDGRIPPFNKSEVLMDIRPVTSSYGAMAYDPSSKNGKKPDQAKTVVKSAEVVAFSDTSLNMQKVKEAVYKAPDIRIAIVEKIKEKIKNDDYPIDSKMDTVLERMRKEKII